MTGTDRIAHDHPSIDHLRARLDRAGRTDRPKLVVPGLDPREAPVRLVLDGRTRYAPVERGLDGETELRGAYDNARRAREREGPDRLREWADARGLSFGRSVHLDRIGVDHFGLRAPGETATYDAGSGISDSLRDIARDMDG